MCWARARLVLPSALLLPARPQVRTLFAVAGWVAPSVIFIDEIDSLLSARKAEGAWGAAAEALPGEGGELPRVLSEQRRRPGLMLPEPAEAGQPTSACALALHAPNCCSPPPPRPQASTRPAGG